MVTQVPSDAVSDRAALVATTRAILEDLDLLGTSDEIKAADGAGSVFSGPPQSVALIEAGLTAATKWWASGLGAAVIAAWVSVKQWYPDRDTGEQIATLGAAALVTAALVIAISYLLASDVRGRALAATATIEARTNVAIAVLAAAKSTAVPPPAVTPPADQTDELIPLPAPLPVKNNDRAGDDEAGWTAVAIARQADDTLAYVVVKGSDEEILPASKLRF